ncbi:phosphodiester glycosidase family protein [Nocardioides ferulae]|uniref:phosphodiester glycosidase family protein n=1 Tax=Nocardioides ferulae TaxID=2340821 RepID=UPI000EAE6235|nr:phosphodiester glycosidase family protein [Nocardioides ferulae]
MRTRLTLTAGGLAGVLAGATLAASVSPTGTPSDGPDGTASTVASGSSGARPDDHGTPSWARQGGYPDQTSDGVAGEQAARVPSFLRGGPVTTRQRTSAIAPGVSLVRWSQHDARGPLRLQLLVVDTDTPGIQLDYGAAGPVPRTAPVTTILSRDGAVAGVNGDFFDIGDTGAPLGVGRERGRPVRHAPLAGWNRAFVVAKDGSLDITEVPMVARVREHPDLTITNVNSPSVRSGGIGIYTAAWGRTPGRRVTDGQRKRVRVVHVRDGRVRSNRLRMRAGRPLKGVQLVGRDDGARQLRRLRVGSAAHVRWWLAGGPRMAIGGNLYLIREGVQLPIDDREMHPRTAVGIDRDTGEVLLLTVDGRQSFSRGMTMVELARTMMDLGADEALNLDGGGSTTMAVRRAGGLRVVNSPSDGSQRSVPNALEVLYSPGG